MRPNPCALSIAGLDPSGGAGVFADLRAFAASGVWGCAAATLVTVQSTAGMRSSRPIETRFLLEQIREVFAHENIRAIKIGALGSSSNARGVGRWLAAHAGRLTVVLDPVIRPTRGRTRLLEQGGVRTIRAMMKHLTVVTPNVPEAEALLGVRIRSIEDAERAARAFVELGARAALVKGGHLEARETRASAIDVLAVNDRIVHLAAPRVKARLHGTGCSLSSLLAGRLAASNRVDDDAIVRAAKWAKRRLARAIATPLRIGDGLLVVPL
jgi:hydroxymethylpyrimidine kinase/phosphomethylpyrimidine kinase